MGGELETGKISRNKRMQSGPAARYASETVAAAGL